MIEAKVYNQTGTAVGSHQLNPAVFEVKVNPPVVQQAVVAQQANARPVLASTKGRGEVSGGGRKPWRQKGTGRARHGSIRSPLWRGGGVTFGPSAARNFSLKINKKVRRKALLMTLSGKAADGRIVLLDELKLPAIKSKAVVTMLESLPLWPKKAKGAKTAAAKKKTVGEKDKPAAKSRRPRVLVVMPASDQVVVKSARNVVGISVMNATDLNVLAVLQHQYLLMPLASLEKIERTFLVK